MNAKEKDKLCNTLQEAIRKCDWRIIESLYDDLRGRKRGRPRKTPTKSTTTGPKNATEPSASSDKPEPPAYLPRNPSLRRPPPRMVSLTCSRCSQASNVPEYAVVGDFGYICDACTRAAIK